MSSRCSSRGSSCQIVEDVTVVRRRRVSLSSTDSEPFVKRVRTEASPTGASVYEADDADSISSGDGRCGGNRACPPPFVGLNDTAEPPEEAVNLYGKNGEPLYEIPLECISGVHVAVVTALFPHRAGSRVSTSTSTCGAAVAATASTGVKFHSCHGISNTTEGNIYHNSSDKNYSNNNNNNNNNNINSNNNNNNSITNKDIESSVTTFSSGNSNNSWCMVVADSVPGIFVLDCGTRVCLPDGAVVGVVTAVMGPVNACVYAILCNGDVFSRLHASGRLEAGTGLHYDLGAQHIISNPAEQCDTTRGTDASYVNDEELPFNARPDFSDDEEERRWKMERRAKKAEGHFPPSVSDDDLSEDERVEVDWVKLAEVEDYLQGIRDAPAVHNNSFCAGNAVGNGFCPVSVRVGVEGKPPEVKQVSNTVRVVVPSWIAR
ncbi:hypothetical protein, conserved [Trypanosoma brucei gambiense DAL972]|uniref:Uncharacterized protein n=1 Tax=Trypanosoma brucei gambiense (strain MHOM/CI/86/DAL972) TaxID=679716 RepID=C9ZJ60_TRYB9|nr:hypothetical protein, conserved [Trypanosoma brucei gambiense DAL972]CBH09418.1 hypothetical protein, conserved [Trypanosoma brucei gambiense DAL972]|eukprot:XP_011771724.1 hypothetical protein, conserved [Trypanosoma brucei gambiense DAL972]